MMICPTSYVCNYIHCNINQLYYAIILHKRCERLYHHCVVARVIHLSRDLIDLYLEV